MGPVATETSTADYQERVKTEVGPAKTGPGYERHSGLYFFVSLDLVNSTAYKARNHDWQFRIRMFYDEAKNFWPNHENGLHPRVWKYQGDEVLFYYKIRSIHELEVAIQSSYRALTVVSKTVRNWTESKYPRLYVKGTCWVANVEYHLPAPDAQIVADDETSTSARNIVFESPLGPGQGPSYLDFLGPEIDAGFRIAAGSIKNALVVSAELASLVWEKGVRKTGDGLRIVDFQELKGVWDGRHYPLIWYREDWSEASLARDYDYDDPRRHLILAKAKEARPDSLKELGPILVQVQRDWLSKMELPATPPDGAGELDVAVTADDLEVHCVAVCFDQAGKVLLAKRPSTKANFPDLWEAGCARLRFGDDFYTAMQRDYLVDFGVRVTFDRFVPWGVVGSYSFEKHGVITPGVVFVGEVQEAGALKAMKHARADWFDPDHLPDEIVSNGVPNLADRVRRAAAVWKATPRPAPPPPPAVGPAPLPEDGVPPSSVERSK